MNLLRHTVRTIVGLVLLLSLSLGLLTRLPHVQQRMGQAVAEALGGLLHTSVSVGSIEVAINGRIVVHELDISDQRGKPLLHASRAGAKLNLWELFKGRVRIGNAQLFGLNARLCQERADTAANYQFVLDALSDKDTTETLIDLRIGQLIIRRANISYERPYLPVKRDRFSPSHLRISNLNANLTIDRMRPDSLCAELRRLDAQLMFPKHTTTDSVAFRLLGAKGSIHAGKHGIHLRDISVLLPQSQLNVELSATGMNIALPTLPHHLETQIEGRLSLEDVACFLPQKARLPHVLEMGIKGTLRDSTAWISRLEIKEKNGQGILRGTAHIENVGKDIKKLRMAALIQELTLQSELLSPYVKTPLVQQLGKCSAQGAVSYDAQDIKAQMDIQTPHGSLTLSGHRTHGGYLEADIQSTQLRLKELLKGILTQPVNSLAVNAKVSGNPTEKLYLKATVPNLSTDHRTFNGLSAQATLRPGNSIDGRLSLNDKDLQADIEGHMEMKHKHLRATANIRHIRPHALGVKALRPQDSFSMLLSTELSTNQWNNPQGYIHADRLCLYAPDTIQRIGDIHLGLLCNGDERNIRLVSPQIEGELQGRFSLNQLGATLREILRTYVPTLSKGNVPHSNKNDYATLRVRLYDTQLLSRLLDIPLSIQGSARLDAGMNLSTKAIQAELKAPHIDYANEKLRDICLSLHGNGQELKSKLKLQRLLQHSTMDIGLETLAEGEKLHNILSWNNNQHPSVMGDINADIRFTTTPHGKAGLKGEILPSTVIIADSIWNMNPGAFAWEDGILSIDSLRLGNNTHSIALSGKASALNTDTLNATLTRINLEYIFSLLNFDAVLLSGEATGNILLHSLFSKPQAEAKLYIPHFHINDADMGLLNIQGNWGKRPYSIFLDGTMSDNQNNALGRVTGYITPKKDISYHGLDLNINAQRMNVALINKYTNGILDDIQVRASGQARLFGPFKELDITGNLCIEEGAFSVPTTGVRYHMEKDSIFLRPGEIRWQGVTLYDPQGSPEKEGHRAHTWGVLRHTNFSNMHFDISAQGNNILGYNFTRPNSMDFWGQVWADGKININGQPGKVNINIQAKPLRGSRFVYNMSQPEHLRQSNFVSYISPATAPETETTQNKQENETPQNQDTETDLKLNFSLDLTPQAQIELLMGQRSEDMISVCGEGQIRANYHNKNGFQIFGRYAIKKGNYRLTLQNVLHKDFVLKEGSSIAFNGNPMLGQLDVTAQHSVIGVKLNDLSARATFSNNAARVNCIMKVDGTPRQPHLSFDFDILNVNDDEKRMVRSLVSTEEERNLQVIYLLSIGRFYTYNYEQTPQTQSTTAMSSLLSNTLSGQLNQMFQNIIGNRNWNLGANVNTGESGWQEYDVQGAVSGTLLDNRLVINGNFGYRNTPTNIQQTNFIGDIDLQYLLTPSGSVNLKGYNRTNDRYFTKSSLITQGIGLLLRKDFRNLKDLFQIHRRRKSKTQPKD